MAYKLTLTHAERRAIDWVGYRYATGDDLYKILSWCCGPDTEWDQDGDIEFTISEPRAWAISELFEAEDMSFPCFADEFARKLIAFWEGIV